MGEGLSPTEVGKELAEHAGHENEATRSRSDYVVSLIEAALLAIVAVLAAYSGYSSAKWSTESRIELAAASAARTEASRANLDATTAKNFDGSTFNAWFTAYVAGNKQAMAIAVKRFRPEFKVAFDAWLATNPATNPNAPPGPTFMPQYAQPDLVKAEQLDAKADELFKEGSKSGGYADDYVRTTVYLATVLFLIGISGHFRFRGARIGLIVTGSAILTFAVVLLVLAPKPPG